MAKRVFFSFHYQDVITFRANVVRKHDLTKESREDSGFFDASIWEDAKRHGDFEVKRLINNSLNNTSITCALMGSDTWKRRWVRYEILKSYDRGNSLLGIHINGVKDKNQQTFAQGLNVFAYLGFVISADGNTQTYYENNGSEWNEYKDLPPKRLYNIDSKYWNQGYNLSSWVKVHDWFSEDGYNNFPTWLNHI
ncbi:MAG: TIR domain-containing protein [Ferruginibacter sp.]